MKTIELKKKKESLMAEMEVLAKGWSEADQKAFTEKEEECKKLDLEIMSEKKREDFLRLRAQEGARDISDNDRKDIEGYSLFKALREYRKGKLTGVELEMHQQAERDNQKQDGIMGLGIPAVVLVNKKMQVRSTLAAGSSPIVQTDNVGFIDALWARTLCAQMGTKTLSGLTGNVDLPYLATKPTVKWAATENASAADAAVTLDKISLTPKRITNYVPLSNQLIMQNNKSVEQLMWNALIKAAAVKLDYGAINGANGSGEPCGILSWSGIGSVAIGTDGGAPTLAKILEIIREVAIDDAELGALGFMTNPYVRYKCQTVARVSSTDSVMLWDPNGPDRLMGYNAGVTTQVPHTLDKGSSTGVCSALIFGNWNDLTMAQFGAFDLITDTMTAAKEATTNLILHGWFDVAVDHASSFAACKDITTS